MSSIFSPNYQPQWDYFPDPTCGLYTTVNNYGRRFLPVVSVDVHTTIVSSTSRTVLTQTFLSPKIATSGHLQNLSYMFPLYDGVSVIAFTCTAGSRVISGIVKERNKAKQLFDAAAAQGRTAGLLEQSLEASDVFTTSLGNIPLGENIKVEITYLGELKHDAQVDGLRFTIPMSVAQRYGHHTLGSPVVGKEHLNITVDVDVSGGSTIKSVQSVSHPISVNIGALSTATSEPPSLQRAYATLSQDSAELNKDFVIQVVATGLGDPMAVLEAHPTVPNQRALMATLVPRFNLPTAMSEVIFMCDRSGSMSIGKKMPNVIQALNVFLRSLPVGIKFNICSFGSNHSFLWERSQTYDENSLTTAISHVSSFDANFGGTEMYAPMTEIFRRRYSDMNLEVFLLTDGATWDQETLFDLIRSHVVQSKGAIRVFTLGVGEAASHALIEGAARAGNGFSQAVADGERVDKMLVRMLKGALTPHINDYTLEIKYGNEVEEEGDDDYELIEKVMDAMTLEMTPTESADIKDKGKKKIEISLFDQSVQDEDLEVSGTSDVKMDLPAVAVPRYLQAPFQIPPLFPFSRTTVYVLLSDSTPSRQPKSVILRGTSSQGPLSLEIPIAILPEKGTTIHQLAARKATRELEDGRGWIFHAKDEQGKLLKQRYDGQFGDMVKREVVRLGTQYQISGKWCSFVAIEDGKEKADESEEVVIDDTRSSDTRCADTRSSDLRCADTRSSDLRCADTRSSDTRSADAGFANLRSPVEDVRRRNTAASHQFRKRKAKNQEHEATKIKMRMETQPTGVGSEAGAGQSGMGMHTARQQAQQQAIPQAQHQAQLLAQQQAQEQAERLAMIELFGVSSAQPQHDHNMQVHPLEQQGRRRSMMVQAEQTPSTARGSTETESAQLPTCDGDGDNSAKFGDVSQGFDFGGFQDQSEDMIDYSDEEAVPQVVGAVPKVVEAVPQAVPAAERDPMSILFSEQTFRGNWDWSPSLEGVVGVTQSAATTEMKLPGRYDQLDLVLATLCAVAYLKKKLADEKDVWELIVQKAEDWLRGQTQEDVMELEKIAERVLFEKYFS